MSAPQPAAHGSRFFSISAILIGSLVVLSFPLSYFIPAVSGSKRFSLLHHLHGLAFFAWVGLYVLQTRLVRSGNIRRHREFGIACIALAGAMLPLVGVTANGPSVPRVNVKGALPSFEITTTRAGGGA